MAIAELVHALVFCRSSNKKPIASEDMAAFESIPLPLMTYACVAVSCCVMAHSLSNESLQLCAALEEYKTGEFVKQNFTEAEYKPYYEVLLKNLLALERSNSRGWMLDIVRKYIFDKGK